MIGPPEDIWGWTTFGAVYQSAVDAAGADSIFVEVGCWLGKSTVMMAQMIRESGKPITFYAIDTFKGSPSDNGHQDWIKANGQPSLRRQFEDNLKRYGVEKLVHVIQAESPAIAANFVDESLDFVFIDADHDPEPCLADIMGWLPKVKAGGVLAGHDYDDCHEGVLEAVKQSGLKVEAADGNCWRHTKKE